jgi:DNA invertase Pin-like site-specific DNA recombinase
MKENENAGSIEEQKRKIRARYRGISQDELEVIPAAPIMNFHEDDREKKVAVYARVSTDDPNQTSSYELQKNHYTDTISRHPGWKLVDIYADEGISGTSLKHRDAFLRMISDCEAGKIDLILTKSVSRFARNVLDCVGYARALAAMNPPVEIFFETEGIHTLAKDSEMMLAFLATMAQEESHNKSEIMNASIEMRFARGIFLTPVLLGYDHDEEGNLIINEEEALTVKLIFFMYLCGYPLPEIANTLTTLKRRTKKGNTVWSATSLLQTLQNERYCGDVLAHKTYTPNYLDHKSKKNNQNRPQYRQRDHHEAIISRDDFNAVQKLIKNSKYGHKGFLPALHVITEGSLKGYVSINPTWAGFKPIDYYDAISATIKEPAPTLPDEGAATSGEFDLRGFEIVHSQFFSSVGKITATFSSKIIQFSTFAVNKLSCTDVELLVNPYMMSFAVRPATTNSKNRVAWAKLRNDKYYPREVRGMGFLPTLFEMFKWRDDCRYRVTGAKYTNDGESVLIFDLSSLEIYIPPEVCENASTQTPSSPPSNTGIVAYPAEWANNFGNPFYQNQYSHEASAFHESKDWNIAADGQAFCLEQDQNVTSPDELNRHISNLVNEMRKGAVLESANDSNG